MEPQPTTSPPHAEIEQETSPVLNLAQQIVTETRHEQAHFFKGDIQCARDKTLKPLTKTVYMILCTYRNNISGEAWPSRNTIAEHAGCQANAVRTAINELEQAGYIKKQSRFINGQQTSNLITFPTLKPATASHSPSKPDTVSAQTNTAPEPPAPATTPTQSARREQNTNQPTKQSTSNQPARARYKQQYQPQQADTRPRPALFIPSNEQPKFDLAKHRIKQIKQNILPKLKDPIPI